MTDILFNLSIFVTAFLGMYMVAITMLDVRKILKLKELDSCSKCPRQCVTPYPVSLLKCDLPSEEEYLIRQRLKDNNYSTSPPSLPIRRDKMYTNLTNESGDNKFHITEDKGLHSSGPRTIYIR